MRVLIADDHALFRQGLRQMLELRDSSLKIIEASGGAEALELAAKTAPDLAIMDIAMPGLDGLEATRQLRARFPGTRVIILSSYGDKTYVKQAFKYGAQGFVLKDAVFEELLLAMEAVKNNNRYVCPRVMEPILKHYLDVPSPSTDLAAYNSLTSREQQIFKLLAKGESRRLIAQKLSLSTKTIDTHCFNLLNKLKLKNDWEIAHFVTKLQQEQE